MEESKGGKSVNIKAAKEKLDLYVALYGTQDERTLKVSQEADKFVNTEMIKMMEGKKGKYDTARSSSIRSV